MEPVDSQSSAWRYGDFPDLFWDAQPQAVIDTRNSVTLARLLTRGRAAVIGKLVPLAILEEGLESVDLPEHVQLFWRTVLRRAPTRPQAEPSQGADS